jgi:hypothetical protein
LIRLIYISWRKGEGSRRYIIAKVKKNASGYTFAYIPEEVEKAAADGFQYFPGFQDLNKEYTENVIETLSLRLMPKDRPDRQNYLAFWEAQNEKDPFTILGLTQAKSFTDNFEFLARYNPVSNLKFVTDLAGLSYEQLARDTVKVGDLLRYELDPDNKYDRYAVKVFKDKLFLGYFKKVHSRVLFKHKKSQKPFHLTVKAVDQNGTIKQIFVKVEAK